jgi:hypothetical protein
MAVLFLAVVWGFFFAPLGTQLGNFRQWANENTDVESIRDWAATLKEVPDGTRLFDLPPAVEKLHPYWVSKNGPGQVRISWNPYYCGSRWIVVGPQSLKIPLAGSNEWIRSIAPGAYVYYGDAGL